MRSKITGMGSYIPSHVVTNDDFLDHTFLDIEGGELSYDNKDIISKFQNITGIVERRYADNDMTTSQMGTIAARKAIEESGVDAEEIDYIIFAHNFGNIKSKTIQSDAVPSLAARVKNELRIQNPKCVAYDLLFGCPGWLEGVIHANAFIKAGIARKCLIIGGETLSRVTDPHDRDSMIYSDGAGACILEASSDDSGIIAHNSATYTYDEVNFLFYGNSNNKSHDPDVRYIKMYGRKIYEFALNFVPMAMKDCLESSGIPIEEVKKVFIHQANEKMDEAIIHRFFKLYDRLPPEHIMPMSIHTLGNSSVATVPTLFDLVLKGEIENQSIEAGDIVIFASVGAGMNINAMIYRL